MLNHKCNNDLMSGSETCFQIDGQISNSKPWGLPGNSQMASHKLWVQLRYEYLIVELLSNSSRQVKWNLYLVFVALLKLMLILCAWRSFFVKRWTLNRYCQQGINKMSKYIITGILWTMILTLYCYHIDNPSFNKHLQ